MARARVMIDVEAGGPLDRLLNFLSRAGVIGFHVEFDADVRPPRVAKPKRSVRAEIMKAVENAEAKRAAKEARANRPPVKKIVLGAFKGGETKTKDELMQAGIAQGFTLQGAAWGIETLAREGKLTRAGPARYKLAVEKVNA